jgi:CRISPR-associated endonuclease Cas2
MYDITHDKTLQKVARYLEQVGYERINYSVWYGAVHPYKNVEIREKLKVLLKNPAAKGSRLYYLPMNIKTLSKMRHFNGKKIEQMDYWTGKIQTMFF